MNLCCIYIQFLVSACVSDLFFYSVLYHETSKLVDSSQTGPQWRISLRLSFVLESYNLATLLKQTISYQLFYINLERAHQRMFYLAICTPNSFCLLYSRIFATPIFAQILSCLYPPKRRRVFKEPTYHLL